jgi:hypothetical protein
MLKVNINFVPNYFDTLQGIEAYKELIETNQIDMNHHIAKKVKDSNTD